MCSEHLLNIPVNSHSTRTAGEPGTYTAACHSDVSEMTDQLRGGQQRNPGCGAGEGQSGKTTEKHSLSWPCRRRWLGRSKRRVPAQVGDVHEQRRRARKPASALSPGVPPSPTPPPRTLHAVRPFAAAPADRVPVRSPPRCRHVCVFCIL